MGRRVDQRGGGIETPAPGAIGSRGAILRVHGGIGAVLEQNPYDLDRYRIDIREPPQELT